VDRDADEGHSGGHSGVGSGGCSSLAFRQLTAHPFVLAGPAGKEVRFGRCNGLSRLEQVFEDRPISDISTIIGSQRTDIFLYIK